MNDVAIEKVQEFQAVLQQQMDQIKELQLESSMWLPTETLQLSISDLLHEECSLNHTDGCGYYMSKNDSSYYKRAGQIIDWCKENNIKPEFMLHKHKNMLKQMFL